MKSPTALIFALLAASAAWPAVAQQSENFSMDRIVVTAAGATVSSASFETTVTIAQDSPAGAASSCNTGFINSIGFWSVLGDLPVPIWLRVAKNPGDPSAVELSWSGAHDVFEVYRAVSAQNVLEPTNLFTHTSSCAVSDDRAPASNIIFYNVVPQSQN